MNVNVDMICGVLMCMSGQPSAKAARHDDVNAIVSAHSFAFCIIFRCFNLKKSQESDIALFKSPLT